jgi:hypothetical protein
MPLALVQSPTSQELGAAARLAQRAVLLNIISRAARLFTGCQVVTRAKAKSISEMSPA